MNRPRRTTAVAMAAAMLVALTACGETEGPDDGALVTVAIPEFSFDPDPVVARVGDSVVWTNRHDQAHTATGTGELDFDTGNIPAGEASEPIELTEVGTFTYRCALHPFMEGAVAVSD